MFKFILPGGFDGPRIQLEFDQIVQIIKLKLDLKHCVVEESL